MAPVGSHARLKTYLELMRPLNCVMGAVAAALGYFLSAGGLHYDARLPFVVLAAFCICAAGQSINDYFDRGIDARRKAHRPIPSGRILPSQVLVFSANLFLVGIAVSLLFLPTPAFIIALAYSLILVAYSAVLAKVKYVGNWLVALGTGLTYLFGATLSGDYGLALILALGSLAANVGREIAKDCEDLEMDRGSKRTLPMVIGEKKARIVSAFFFALAVPVSLLPAFLPTLANQFPSLISFFSQSMIAILPKFHQPAFLILIAIASAFLLRAAWWVMKEEYALSQKLAKYGMAIALVAYFAALI